MVASLALYQILHKFSLCVPPGFILLEVYGRTVILST